MAGSLSPRSSPEPLSIGRRWLLALLVADAVVLALVELFFLPLRFDGAALPKLRDFPVPATVVFAGFATPWLVTQTAKLVRPGLSWIPLLGWALTVIAVGIAGPGGDRVLLQDWRGLLLFGAGALPGAIALGANLASATRGGQHG